MRAITASAVLFAVTGAPAHAQNLEYGKAEYRDSCAACHGATGMGDGPLAEELMTRPADLTRLSRANGGEFPYWKVFSSIDGRYLVPAHGTREMPIWGREFLAGDAQEYGAVGGEAVTQERIHALTEYLATLQRE